MREKGAYLYNERTGEILQIYDNYLSEGDTGYVMYKCKVIFPEEKLGERRQISVYAIVGPGMPRVREVTEMEAIAWASK